MTLPAEPVLESLARRVRDLRKLARAVEAPLRVPLGAAAGEALNRIASRAGVRAFDLQSGSQRPTSFERIAATHLGMNSTHEMLLQQYAQQPDALDAFTDRSGEDHLDTRFSCTRVQTEDGVALNAYAGGNRTGNVVLIVPVCGMPIELCELWMRALGRTSYVVTWETRALFAACETLDENACSVEAQAGDLFAVMNHFGIGSAHLMGLCGGAVVAIAAAAQRPQRCDSLSLWYGDYDLGGAAAKTKHQRELVKLLAMAGTSRKDASSLQKLFCDASMLTDIPANVAHLVAYPYANAELLYRYARINGRLMGTDVRAWLPAVSKPTLVVTSSDDSTAHPDGSLYVAGAIADAQLHVEPHGDHLTLFEAPVNCVRLALDFALGQSLPRAAAV